VVVDSAIQCKTPMGPLYPAIVTVEKMERPMWKPCAGNYPRCRNSSPDKKGKNWNGPTVRYTVISIDDEKVDLQEINRSMLE